MLGKEHPDTLSSVYCLAHLLHCIKRYKDVKLTDQRLCIGYRCSKRVEGNLYSINAYPNW